MNARMVLPDTPRATPRLRPPKTRIPVTICLDPEQYEFVQRCVETAKCGSMDEVIEFALANLKKLLGARRSFVIRHMVGGHTYSQIMRSLDDGIVLALGKDERTRKKRRTGKPSRSKLRKQISAKRRD